ncbi:hypothetical protein AOLI_G00041910 [Acnodon oligacanthus]
MIFRPRGGLEGALTVRCCIVFASIARFLRPDLRSFCVGFLSPAEGAKLCQDVTNMLNKPDWELPCQKSLVQNLKIHPFSLC